MMDAIIAGLADACRTIAGIRVYDFPADRIEPPAIVMELPELTAISFQGGSFEVQFAVWLLIAKVDDRASAREAIQYVDPASDKSIRGAIEADRTLGGACDSVAVVAQETGRASVAGTEYLAVEFTVEVIK